MELHESGINLAAGEDGEGARTVSPLLQLLHRYDAYSSTVLLCIYSLKYDVPQHAVTALGES